MMNVPFDRCKHGSVVCDRCGYYADNDEIDQMAAQIESLAAANLSLRVECDTAKEYAAGCESEIVELRELRDYWIAEADLRATERDALRKRIDDAPLASVSQYYGNGNFGWLLTDHDLVGKRVALVIVP